MTTCEEKNMAETSKDKNVPSEMSSKTGNNEETRGNSEQEEFLPGYPLLQNFTKVGYKSLVEMTKTSNSLPDAENWPYFASFPSFQDAMVNQSNQVIKLYALNLDEVAGIRKNPEPANTDTRKIARPLSGSWNQMNLVAQRSIAAMNKHARLLTQKVIEKPQIHFKDKVDNSFRPFEPRIKEKPHSKKPLSLILELTENGEGYSHPYRYELDLYEPLEEHLTEIEPRLPRPISDTPCKFVDNAESLKNMMSDLKGYKELAVDVEHHSYRSFQGFTCLMQISTHHCDYVIDAIQLRDQLHVLNEVFTNPKILKVLHGAESDIEWLQRDLSVYIVNMFDTHVASKILGLSRLSLAYLVKLYCKVDLDKAFQLADWRLRPLLPEMIEYARSDTHYLLYIHDCMRNQLWENGSCTDRLTRATLIQSNLICKKIAENLPREMQGILACCNPIPPLVRQNLGQLHRFILQAREQPLIQTGSVEAESSSVPKESWTKINIESPLHCPHQLPPREEQSDNLPTLLGDKAQNKIVTKSPLLSSSPRISSSGSDMANKVLSPFQRYLLVKPYMQHLAAQTAAAETTESAANPPPTSTSQETADQQRMERIKQHFMALDAAAAPPEESESDSRSESPEAKMEHDSDVEIIEPEGPPTKRPKLEDTEPTRYDTVPKSVRQGKTSKRKEKKRQYKFNNQNSQFPVQQSPQNIPPDMHVVMSKHDAAQEMPAEAMSSLAEPAFDYSSVDFNRFQGGSKHDKKPHHNQNNRGGKFGRGRGRKPNFHQKSQKSFTYKKGN
ncbi:hypothetical protein B566_EDAN002192 [Ephemera danica]|nr:hypothetical protein B566_EDAN002192 [Ephemera danica]